MKYSKIDKQLFKDNRQRLAANMEPQSVAILFSNDVMPRGGDQTYAFHQHADLFYLSGIDQADTILALCPQHENPALREVLFITENNEHSKIWTGNKYSKEESREISGISTVYWCSEAEKILRELILSSKTIYFDLPENKAYVPQVTTNNERQAAYYRSLYPLHNYARLAPIMEQLRVQKSSIELQLLQQACKITGDTFKDLLTQVHADMGEYEIEGRITNGFLSRRATCHSFHPIVASGKNACILHYEDNHDICQDGDLLLLDMGAEYAHYAGDLSRTIPINSKFSPRQKQIYEACLEVFNYAKTLYVPGMSINKIHRLTLQKMQEQLLKIDLIKQQDIEQEVVKYDSVRKYFMHGTAHFVGLDVHDVGGKDTVLDYGMVLSCEPGIYVAEEGIGIRIETMMQVNDHPIDMMADVPSTVQEIESIMQK